MCSLLCTYKINIQWQIKPEVTKTFSRGFCVPNMRLVNKYFNVKLSSTPMSWSDRTCVYPPLSHPYNWSCKLVQPAQWIIHPLNNVINPTPKMRRIIQAREQVRLPIKAKLPPKNLLKRRYIIHTWSFSVVIEKIGNWLFDLWGVIFNQINVAAHISGKLGDCPGQTAMGTRWSATSLVALALLD